MTTLPGLPPPEPIELEPELERVVRVKFQCPTCKVFGSSEDPKLIVRLGAFQPATFACRCGQHIRLRRKQVQGVTQMPNRAERRAIIAKLGKT